MTVDIFLTISTILFLIFLIFLHFQDDRILLNEPGNNSLHSKHSRLWRGWDENQYAVGHQVSPTSSDLHESTILAPVQTSLNHTWDESSYAVPTSVQPTSLHEADREMHQYSSV